MAGSEALNEIDQSKSESAEDRADPRRPLPKASATIKNAYCQCDSHFCEDFSRHNKDFGLFVFVSVDKPEVTKEKQNEAKCESNTKINKQANGKLNPRAGLTKYTFFALDSLGPKQ